MLKKVLITAAVAAAAALAAAPFALAHTDQDKHQYSAEGNGILHGDNVNEGNAADHCNNSLAAEGSVHALDAQGDCATSGEAYGQKVEQYHSNDDD